MRASIIIASHNEGAALGKTIESCIETCVDLDYELVVADDASTDGSAEDVSRRFSQVRLYRHGQRQGASPTKALGVRNARGNVLVFLDGHTKPEYGAVARLVQDVEALAGTAVITPTIVALDVQRWKTDVTQAGHGYSLDLQTFDPRWQALDEMQSAGEGRTRFYVSPALIGCGFAVGRELYDKLWGFDVQMHYWGVEDLDFGLKCWLMGHRILHDPQAVIGHHFRATFDNYSVPVEHLLVNQLRMARKNFTHAVWADWLERCRQRHLGPLAEHPEGLWAHVWQLFESERASAEQERSYLHARRVRDEFWYAERFGLAWPRLQVEAGAAPSLTLPFALPSPRPSPSPPPTCKVTGINPAVATVIVGLNRRFTAQGTLLGSVNWTTNPAGSPATGSGPTFTAKWSSSGVKQVTASCGGTSKTASVTVVSVTGVLTPSDNFTGRSNTRFGVGEIINLSFQSTPPRTAAQLGGLIWSIASGGGTLTGNTGNNGKGVYTAPATAGSVTLELTVVSGPNANSVVARRTINIVAPSDALMVQRPGTNVKHTTGLWSVGFKGNVFLRPTDVSFSRMQWGEGTVNAVASGYLAIWNGRPHLASQLFKVGPGDSTLGCRVMTIDTVFSGELGPPFSIGDFLWAIPWEFSVGGSPRVSFTTANHHATADAVGTATISKKGAGPFSRIPGDPTLTFMTVTGINPMSGPAAGGTSVTILGTSFESFTGVGFGVTGSTNVTLVSDSELTAVSPSGTIGTVDVTVVSSTPPETSPTSPADQFTYI